MNEIGKYGVASIYRRQTNAIACTEITFKPHTFLSFVFNSSNRLLPVTCKYLFFLEPSATATAQTIVALFLFFETDLFIQLGGDDTIENIPHWRIEVPFLESNRQTLVAIDNLVVGRWWPKFTLTILKHFFAICCLFRTSFSINQITLHFFRVNYGKRPKQVDFAFQL